MTGMNKKIYGDYQTPLYFAREIVEILSQFLSSPKICFEPTCGKGNFLKAAMEKFPNSQGIGVEINSLYVNECRIQLKDYNVKIYHQDIFSFNYKNNLIANENDEYLILGNPPWATNSDLSANGGINVPRKRNIKGLNGFEAMTGSSNFDICEYIILDLIKNFHHFKYVLGMLCKTSVAINVIKEIKRRNIIPQDIVLIKFDAKSIFNVAADAALLIIKNLNHKDKWKGKVNVYDLNETTEIQSVMGFMDDKFYTNLNSEAAEIEGQCQFEWRQGIKHDLSKVMELTMENNQLINGYNERVQIESELVFPLIKSSRVRKYHDNYMFDKYVIITQEKVGKSTDIIKSAYPKTWEYLMSYKEQFSDRKSSIYKNAPMFSIFGVGDYSFKKHKVTISGFYKEPVFKCISHNKPVMLDDTCYFLGFESYINARITQLLLSTTLVQEFINSVSNLESKRPFTKKVLSRIDLKKVSDKISYEKLIKLEKNEYGRSLIKREEYTLYRQKLSELSNRQLYFFDQFNNQEYSDQETLLVLLESEKIAQNPNTGYTDVEEALRELKK